MKKRILILFLGLTLISGGLLARPLPDPKDQKPAADTKTNPPNVDPKKQQTRYFPPPREESQKNNLPPQEPASQITKEDEEKVKVQDSSSGKRISLELKNIDIVEVLKLLAQKGNINIVAGRNVRGRVTLFLKDVLIWDALKIIFDTNELAYMQEGEILKVMTDKEYEQVYGVQFQDRRKMEIVTLKYAKAETMGNALKQVKSRIGNIIIDPRINTLILIDTEEGLVQMRELIAKLDVPVTTKTFSLEHLPAKKVEEIAKNIISKEGSFHMDVETNKVVVTDSIENIIKLEKIIKEIDKQSYLETRIFSLDYAKVKDVESKIQEKLTKDVGTLSVDERTNKLVVTDLPEVVKKIEGLIPAYDEMTKEVLIEAKIVQVALSDSFQLGINWERIVEGFKDNNLNFNLSTAFDMISENSVSATSTFEEKISTIAGGRIVATGTLESKDQFTAILNALKTIGNTNLLSTPTIAAINNEEAKIQVGTREAFVTDTVVQSSSTSTTAQNVTFIDVGIILSVTPNINNVGYITMKIKPEISAVSSTVATASGNVIPIVETQEAETTIMVKDGTTIVIGGLIQNKQVKSTKKVPFIGSIPFLSLAFKKTGNQIIKNELVIFITPRIIEGKTPEAFRQSKRLDDFVAKMEEE